MSKARLIHLRGRPRSSRAAASFVARLKARCFELGTFSNAGRQTLSGSDSFANTGPQSIGQDTLQGWRLASLIREATPMDREQKETVMQRFEAAAIHAAQENWAQVLRMEQEPN